MNLGNLGLGLFDVRSSGTNAKWRTYLRSFNFLDMGYITSPDLKKALLLHLAGSDVQDVYGTLEKNEPSGSGKGVFELCCDKLDSYFAPKTNKIYERHLFRKMRQNNDSGSVHYKD